MRAAAASLGPLVHTGSPRHGAPGPHAGRPARASSARARSASDCDGQRIEADAVVLAGPAHETADLAAIRSRRRLAALLAGIQTAPLAVVCLGYDAAALAADRGPLDGFGFLVPRGEGPRILGALWETSIYERARAPRGKALLRVMIGGATDPDGRRSRATRRCSRACATDLERTMGLRIAPEFVHVVRHRRGIPQYTIGHAGRLERIEAALPAHPGLFVAGNSYRGVSVNACIEDARRSPTRVAEHLDAAQPRGELRRSRADGFPVAPTGQPPTAQISTANALASRLCAAPGMEHQEHLHRCHGDSGFRRLRRQRDSARPRRSHPAAYYAWAESCRKCHEPDLRGVGEDEACHAPSIGSAPPTRRRSASAAT